MTASKQDIVSSALEAFRTAGGDINPDSLTIMNALVGIMIRGAALAKAIRVLKGKPTTMAAKAAANLFDKAMADFEKRITVYQSVISTLDGVTIYAAGKAMTPGAVASMLDIDASDFQSYYFNHVVGAILEGEPARPGKDWGKTYGPDILMPEVLAEFASKIPSSPSKSEVFIGRVKGAVGLWAGAFSYVVGSAKSMKEMGAEKISSAKDAVREARDFLYDSVVTVSEYASGVVSGAIGTVGSGASGMISKQMDSLVGTAKDEIKKAVPDLMNTVRGEVRKEAAAGARSATVPLLVGAGIVGFLFLRK